MIKYENGRGQLTGTGLEILAEFTAIIKTVYKFLAETGGEAIARKTIAEAGRLALLDEDEIRDEYLKSIQGAKGGEEK